MSDKKKKRGREYKDSYDRANEGGNLNDNDLDSLLEEALNEKYSADKNGD